MFDVVFSEPVTGFTGSDISLAGSTVGGTPVANVSGSGSTYTVTVTGQTGLGTIVANLPAGTVTDLAGNPTAASTSTDNTVDYDGIAPTVAIEQAGGQTDPTNAGPVLFDLTFSEPVVGFDASDISFAGSTVGGTPVASLSGSGLNWVVSVTGMSGEGTLVASLPAGAVQDPAGTTTRRPPAWDNSVLFDNVAPTVTVGAAAGQPDPVAVGPIVFDVVFSEPVTGFTAVDTSASTVGGT